MISTYSVLTTVGGMEMFACSLGLAIPMGNDAVVGPTDADGSIRGITNPVRTGERWASSRCSTLGARSCTARIRVTHSNMSDRRENV